MTIDKYDLFYTHQYNNLDELTSEDITYDLFISAYNNETMVQDVFNHIFSHKKIWLDLPDYTDVNSSEIENITEQIEIYSNSTINIEDNDLESHFIKVFFEQHNIMQYQEKKICIDITGFVKPYMIYLIVALEYIGFKKFDIIYSEPKVYKNQEDTEFSEEEIIATRNINGFDTRDDENEDDLFIINAGYDYRLLINIAGYKKYVKNKKLLIGFPSLQPIMYQENILNLQKAATELNIDFSFKPLYSSSNDPFDTAKIVKDYILQYIKTHPNLKTIYISPLATKSQALGLVLFSILEKPFFDQRNITIKIVYPFTKSYSSSAGKELFKINKYSLEF